MKIALFGGTGLTGSEFHRAAADAGHEVRLLARSTSTIARPDAEVVIGDAFDPDRVAETVTGCDAVVSALGGFGSGTISYDGNANILAAMREQGLHRGLVIHGAHIPFVGDPNNPGIRVIRGAVRLRDRRLLESSMRLGPLLRETGDLDWTLLRICLAKASGPTGRCEIGTHRISPRSQVTTGDIAQVALDALAANKYVRGAPMLKSP